ncbi:MAG: stage III sporulation protein AA [Lachnospiraceae bacterium]
MEKTETIRNLFPREFHKMLSGLPDIIDRLQEIRLRVNCPCIFIVDRMEQYPDKEGSISCDREKAVVLNKEEITAIFNHICNYSPYAYESQLRQGFLTVAGGHRVGVFGQVVMDGDRVALIKQVQFLHIRVVHEVKGAAKGILPYLYKEGRFCNTLVISPPGAGKTTMLRDIARMVSDGNSYHPGMQVCIIDERSEIAGSFMGVPQTHVGIRSDVLDGCPKAIGMLMAVRAMGPQLIVVDELGLDADYEALLCASGCGINLLASVHGNDLSDISRKYRDKENVFHEVFQRFIVLRWDKEKGKYGQQWIVLDEKGNLIAEKQGKDRAKEEHVCGF